ncbi:MAG TPA: bifunctional sulfate adenylyltransferase subunit 1/adenylylsulfate kinase [Acidimicrobiaceae bacterium]|nr:bifunctional sulfate adenylyltransferase subunit 1/adenylylsulfate kinase [Acidimicrobiaceae bacterium]
MSHASELIATDIDAYLAEHERKDLLRLLTCGSVDDGKSTLIGRLLHDSAMIYEDQLASLEADSTTMGSAGDGLDLALLMDGLKAEREQGITIDVAYRYFSTSRRKFIVADTPGHEQYTRNMVTGASTCQLAVVLVDARNGVLDQTRRHTLIAHLLGIQNLVVAINKMDLVGWSQDRFDEVAAEHQTFASGLGVVDTHYMPISALHGDNVVDRSSHLSWHDGPPLMEYLETVDVSESLDLDWLRFPVQLVVRPDLDFRGFAGTIAAGKLRLGDEVVALPSAVRSTVERIVTFDGDLDEAQPGDAVTITLADEIDVSRGDLLVGVDHHPARAHDVNATLVWMAADPVKPGRRLILRSIGGEVDASLAAIHHRIDVNSGEEVSADALALNDIACCTLVAERALLFDPYSEGRQTGSFVLVDRMTNATVAAGMILGATSGWDREPDGGLVRYRSEITPEERVARLGQRPCTVLLTGLTAAGKSTIAAALERRLFDLGRTTVRLDGENVRLGISRDLGFSSQERSENLRRVAEVALLANRQGLIAIAALVAPEVEVRDRARELIGGHRFLEVFVDTPLDVCRQRDPNGHYEAADRGEIPNFPGVSSDYEQPTDMELRLDASVQSVDECVDAILKLLVERGVIDV